MNHKHKHAHRRYHIVDAGWPHVALFVRSGVLAPEDMDHCCFVRAGHMVYFASDQGALEEAVQAQFDIDEIPRIPPAIFQEKPFDTLGNVSRFVETTHEGPSG